MNNPNGPNQPVKNQELPIRVILFFSLGMIFCLTFISTAVESNITNVQIFWLVLFFLCAFMVFLSVSFLVNPLKNGPPRIKLGFALIFSLVWTLSALLLLNRYVQRRPVFDQTYWDKIAQVCSGKGIPSSTTYTGKTGQHAIVPWVKDSIFYGNIPIGWFPNSLIATELVFCYEATQKVVETCQFLPAGSLKRIQFELNARVVSANSAKSIAARIFTGGLPEECPPNLLDKSANQVDITYGTQVNIKDVIDWLVPIVNIQ